MKHRPLLTLGLAALGLLILGAAPAALGQGRGQGFRALSLFAIYRVKVLQTFASLLTRAARWCRCARK